MPAGERTVPPREFRDQALFGLRNSASHCRTHAEIVPSATSVASIEMAHCHPTGRRSRLGSEHCRPMSMELRASRSERAKLLELVPGCPDQGRQKPEDSRSSASYRFEPAVCCSLKAVEAGGIPASLPDASATSRFAEQTRERKFQSRRLRSNTKSSVCERSFSRQAPESIRQLIPDHRTSDFRRAARVYWLTFHRRGGTPTCERLPAPNPCTPLGEPKKPSVFMKPDGWPAGGMSTFCCPFSSTRPLIWR